MTSEHLAHLYTVDQWHGQKLADGLDDILSLPEGAFDRLANPFESKLVLREKFELPTALALLIAELEDYCTQAARLFHYNIEVDYTRHYCGVFKYGDRDKLDVHVDAGISPISGLRKAVTALLYLGDSVGAPLELWNGTSCMDALPSVTSIRRLVETYHGCLLLFENNDYAWHGVSATEGEGQRIVLTVSYMSTNLEMFENRRERAYFVPRPDEVWTDEQRRLRDLRADPKLFSTVYRI